MRCLQGLKVNIDLEATDQGPSGDSLRIREEMGLLIEIQDICDELEILKLVLTDQGETMDKMERVFVKRDGSPKATCRPKNAILAAHLHRIDRMEKAAAGPRKSLLNLLELKQKQANFLEVVQSRILANNMVTQTERTAYQTEVSNQHLQKAQEQLEAMKVQAEETDKQSKILMVFTVVTIVFAPFSLIATAFSVSLDTYPTNSDGSLPTNFFLKYLCKTSSFGLLAWSIAQSGCQMMPMPNAHPPRYLCLLTMVDSHPI
jgi:Mg2+ and Co2+ transporter CorA